LRSECSVLRTRYVLFAVSIEEEEEEEEGGGGGGGGEGGEGEEEEEEERRKKKKKKSTIFSLILRSLLLKEAPFQGNKCTLCFKGKNIEIFVFFRRVTVTVSENDNFRFVIPCVCFHQQHSTICLCI
jgi:hypothetical protein